MVLSHEFSPAPGRTGDRPVLATRFRGGCAARGWQNRGRGAGRRAQAPPDVERADVSGLVVCPGLIDLHVHLREPGQSAKETIATGTAAAARGGFTSIVCMPNTSPAIDNAGTVALIREKAAREGVVNGVCDGGDHEEYCGGGTGADRSLKQAGVVAITDDGHCVQTTI